MELEYVFKIMLYLFVVAVIIGIMIVFKSKFVNICFLPPCEKKESCDVSPIKTSQFELTEDVIDKYYYLCLEKSKECDQDVFCYIITLDTPINPSILNPQCFLNNECDIACDKDVNMVYITYKKISGRVQIGC
jgi:hypothetical protein